MFTKGYVAKIQLTPKVKLKKESANQSPGSFRKHQESNQLIRKEDKTGNTKIKQNVPKHVPLTPDLKTSAGFI